MPRSMPVTQYNPPTGPRALLATLLAAALLTILVTACAATTATAGGPASVDRAALLLQQNNPAAAAQMYEELLTGNPPPVRNDLALAAARAWLAANRAADARRVLDANSAGLTTAQQLEHDKALRETNAALGQRAGVERERLAASPGERNARPGAPAGAPGAALPAVTSLALLLPLTGPQSIQAELIRDGFLAAVARMPEGARPSVRVYDTGMLPVGTALQNARSDGAGMVVGPLTRDEVQAAAEQRPGDLPILLLNNLARTGLTGTNIYQYALAPEDEARQIARHMAASGQRNALLLKPSGSWGTRVGAAFAEELTRNGGRVVAQTEYDASGANLAARVNAVLGIDDSRSRYDQIKSITKATLGFEPKPRPDVDAIFVAGFALPDQSALNPLLQINPILNQFAGDLPRFMTQDGIDADALANRELRGMFLLDIPWLLETAGPVADLRAATESSWSAHGLRQSRYFAFGYDAATLAVALRRQTAWPLAGLTGRLNLAPEGRIERNLLWARVNADGTEQAADPAAH